MRMKKKMGGKTSKVRKEGDGEMWNREKFRDKE